MDCMRALPSDDIAVRIQVPPVITPLRGILEHVLHGSATADDWASLVAVAEALEALCVGTDLVHPADVLSLERGGEDTSLIDRPAHHALQLERLGEEADVWPAERLPQLQEAAMRLVRGISRRIPEQQRGLPDVRQPWWEAERHHGLGDNARMMDLETDADQSPRLRHDRRPRRPSGDSQDDNITAADDSSRSISTSITSTSEPAPLNPLRKE